MKPKLIARSALILTVVSAILAWAVPSEACFSIVVGKNVSTDGSVIIGHGRSNAKAIKNAIRVAKEEVERGFNEKIREAIKPS